MKQYLNNVDTNLNSTFTNLKQEFMKKYILFRQKVQKIHIRLLFGKKKEYSAHIQYKFGFFNKKPNTNFYNNLYYYN